MIKKRKIWKKFVRIHVLSRLDVMYFIFHLVYLRLKKKIYIDSEKENLTDLSNYIEEIS